MILLLATVSLVGVAAAALRWLRVGQREHYLPGVTRFAVRWWGVDPVNRLLFVAGTASALAAAFLPAVGLVAVAVGVVGPVGLGLRGRTSPLHWTSRLGRLAVVVGLLFVAVGAGAVAVDVAPLVAGLALLAPLVVDAGLVLLRPLERVRGDEWVDKAAAALRAVGPTIVAITGSYGKTSTKNIVAHLLRPVRDVVPSPASFNNRMGLARAVNEHLSPDTEVFVAEMGTYGPGEIRELCGWIEPDVAVITAVGPVHLERMGSLETIVAAKREILESADVGVIVVDDPLLATVAEEERARRRIIAVSSVDEAADVHVSADGTVRAGGVVVGSVDPSLAHPGNVAAAVGVVVALGIDPAEVASGLASIPPVAHRRSVGRSERGFDIVDDTFNANPDGARAAVELLGTLGSGDGRRVVVTPGMVELGGRQDDANRAFMRQAGAHGVTDVVVVGRTNRSPLVAGAREAGIASVIVVDTRDEAVEWVRTTLATGDAVLYENDLPDHYP